MKKKLFSLFLAILLVFGNLSPAFAEESEAGGNNLNPIEIGKLPIVTETRPKDEDIDKYVRILFIPETSLVNDVKNYGRIKTKTGEEVALSDEILDGKSVKAKAYYALKAATWQEVLDYKENGEKVFKELVAENDEIDNEKKEEHKFIGWFNSHKYLIVDPYSTDFPKPYRSTKVEEIEYSVAKKNSNNSPICFYSRFQGLPYIFIGNKMYENIVDADDYPIIKDKEGTYYRRGFFKVSYPGGHPGCKLLKTDFQEKYFITEGNNYDTIKFYIRNDVVDRSFGKLRPELAIGKDCRFWYWYGDDKGGDLIPGDDLLTRDVSNYIAYFLRNGEDINFSNEKKLKIPEDIFVVKLVRDDGIATEGASKLHWSSKYGREYVIFKGSTLKILDFRVPTPKAVDSSKKAYWYDEDNNKIENIKDLPITKNRVFTARVEMDNLRYKAGAEDIEKIFGEATSEEDIKNSVIISDYPKNAEDQPTKALIEGQSLPDGKTSGEFNVKVQVKYPDESISQVSVKITVSKSEAEKFEPETKVVEINQNEELTRDKLKEGITNLPDDDIVKNITSPAIDTSEPGNKTARLTINFKDGSSKDVEIPVIIKEIIPEKKDSEKNPPRVPENLRVKDKNKLSQEEIQVITEKLKAANPNAKDIAVDAEGNVTLTYEDGSKNTLNITSSLVDDQEKNSKEGKDKDEEDKNKDFYDHYDYNYFPRINYRDYYEKTYPVYAMAPKKSEEKKASEKISYVFHIGEAEYEIIRDGVSTRVKMDISPLIENGRTMLPLRKVAEVLGAKVLWNEKTRTASFTRDGLRAVIQIDRDEIILSSGKIIKMESKPLNLDNRIFVSVVNVSHVFGLTSGNTRDGEGQNIEWNSEDRSVTITP